MSICNIRYSVQLVKIAKRNIKKSLKNHISLFTHGKCGAAHINVARSTFYFKLHSVWTALHRYVSALAVRPAHI